MAVHDPQRLHDLFHDAVPRRAQCAIVRAIRSAYRTAWEDCERRYDERMRAQAWGYLRWLQVDDGLIGVGDRFDGVARFAKNTPNTHIGHTELLFDKLVLTAAAVPVARDKPRRAAYRELLAESNQLQLFERHSRNRRVWGVILHKPNVVTHSPMEIKVGFIAKDYEGFAAELIDLVSIADSIEAPIVETAPVLRLRTQEDTAG